VRAEAGGVYRYAYRADELEPLARRRPELHERTLDDALELHEWKASAVTRALRPLAHAGNQGVAATRVIDVDAAGTIVAIGATPYCPQQQQPQQQQQQEQRGFAEAPPRPAAVPSLRSRAAAEPEATGAEPEPTAVAPQPMIDSRSSAQAPAEIQKGAEELVMFRIELASEAGPLAQRRDAKLVAEQQVVVVLTVENENLAVIGAREQRFDPPAKARRAPPRRRVRAAWPRSIPTKTTCSNC
jgi:hypothetical protein